MESTWQEIKFTDADVINPDDFIPERAYNPHNMRPWLLHDHGFCVCVVFAQSLQDALDESADAGKLDPWKIDPTGADREDYMTNREDQAGGQLVGQGANDPDYIDSEGRKWWWRDELPQFLGNASEPFDIEGLDILELPNPPFSFCALFNANNEDKK